MINILSLRASQKFRNFICILLIITIANSCSHKAIYEHNIVATLPKNQEAFLETPPIKIALQFTTGEKVQVEVEELMNAIVSDKLAANESFEIISRNEKINLADEIILYEVADGTNTKLADYLLDIYIQKVRSSRNRVRIKTITKIISLPEGKTVFTDTQKYSYSGFAGKGGLLDEAVEKFASDLLSDIVIKAINNFKIGIVTNKYIKEDGQYIVINLGAKDQLKLSSKLFIRKSDDSILEVTPHAINKDHAVFRFEHGDRNFLYIEIGANVMANSKFKENTLLKNKLRNVAIGSATIALVSVEIAAVLALLTLLAYFDLKYDTDNKKYQYKRAY